MLMLLLLDSIAVARRSVVALAQLTPLSVRYRSQSSPDGANLAATLGFSAALIHYGLMTLVSLTAVGAILVIALLVGPPVTAYLLTDRLITMIGLSMLFGVLSAVSGYFVARALDSTISGSMALMVGVWFGLVFLGAPERGVLAVLRRRERQKWAFARSVLRRARQRGLVVPVDEYLELTPRGRHLAHQWLTNIGQGWRQESEMCAGDVRAST